MAKVATHASMPPTSLRYGDDRLKVGSGNKSKRKTPSELRGEQLKRRSAVELVDDPIPPLSNSMNGEIHGLKKPDPPKNPRYIETRMDDIFPVRKPTCRLKMLSGKTTTKENISSGLYKQDNISNGLNDNMKNYPGLSKMAGKSQSIFSWSDISVPAPTLSKDGAVQTCQAAEKFSEKHFLNNTIEDKALTGHFSRESPIFSCLPKDGAEDPVASAAVSKDSRPQTCETTEKGIHNTFRNVAELASTLEKSSCPAVVDMDKALKGLVSHGPIASCFSAKSSEHFGDSTMVGNFCPEFHIPGQKMPLDFTLKTTMQVLASTSVNWFHRFITSGDYCGRPQFSSQLSCWSEQNISHSYGITSTPTDEVLKSFSLHSWVYPESSFPPAIVSALAISAAGGAESDFLSKRQSAWEDSLRCLYYMLRKNVCNIFYVCTPQFVVMFTAGYGSGRSRQSCNAYMSRSTRGLRSLLSEHDVGYYMPLRQSKVEEVSTEDLLDLFEMEKDNPGQTRRLNSLLDVDNSPESLLAFSGNENVHGLYDFLLNYRSFLTSLHGVDVPALYSPVPFRNATLSIPEVRCKEMRSADQIALSFNGSDMKNTNSNEDSSVGLCHSIEIKGLHLPPWIISNMCAVMGFEGRSFEASFITEPSSIGLNVALATASPKSNLQNKEGEAHKDISHDFGFKDAVHSPFLHSASLRGLKYSNGSYTASLSPI